MSSHLGSRSEAGTWSVQKQERGRRCSQSSNLLKPQHASWKTGTLWWLLCGHNFMSTALLVYVRADWSLGFWIIWPAALFRFLASYRGLEFAQLPLNVRLCSVEGSHVEKHLVHGAVELHSTFETSGTLRFKSQHLGECYYVTYLSLNLNQWWRNNHQGHKLHKDQNGKLEKATKGVFVMVYHPLVASTGDMSHYGTESKRNGLVWLCETSTSSVLYCRWRGSVCWA